MDELFEPGIKLSYPQEYSFIFVFGDEREALKVRRNRVNCPSYEDCVNWAKYQKNVSIFVADMFAEVNYAAGDYVGENSETLLCRLEDGLVFTTDLTMVIFH
jgi:ABC-type Fe3+/spermidine/putrescine transport system ATPase subunit